MGSFSINFSQLLQSILDYFVDIYNNPLRIIVMILDLSIVVFILYKFVQSARHSRVWQLLKGIVFVILITILSDILQFRVLNYILTAFMPYGVIAMIVIFQPELRRMLEQLGTNKFTKFFGIGMEKNLETKTKEDIYKIVIAAKELSNEKVGGLIVIERDIQINDIMDSGVRIGADVSPQLLVNLFVPKTPLHDGAVIISHNKIEAAACILPLADDKELASGLGTRHRAALGISRETDAIAVVVSEETGKISVAKDGTLIADLKEEALRNILIKNIVVKKFGDGNSAANMRLKKSRIINKKNNNEKVETKKVNSEKEEK